MNNILISMAIFLGTFGAAILIDRLIDYIKNKKERS